jgi:hypothetical protein
MTTEAIKKIIVNAEVAAPDLIESSQNLHHIKLATNDMQENV